MEGERGGNSKDRIRMITLILGPKAEFREESLTEYLLFKHEEIRKRENASLYGKNIEVKI